ncbi:cupin domain-containing protein [bacterium]|nr:MAG: cupin domain-containing protein [bacterium]
MKERLTVENALAKLAQAQGSEFITLFMQGSLQVEIYKPKAIDRQQPHSRDEIYVIISGSGYFLQGSERQAFAAGEVLFVPAGVVHRFEDFTDDFATWVFFYGPSGGEKSGA